jgi:hypothetical protein
MELGKSSGLSATPDLTLSTSPESIQNGATFTFHSVGIDSDREAAIQINNRETYYLPKPKTFTPQGLGISEVKVQGNKMTLGNNTFKIVSFKIPVDPIKGLSFIISM